MTTIIKPKFHILVPDINEIVGHQLHSFKSLSRLYDNQIYYQINLQNEFSINIKGIINDVLFIRPSETLIIYYLGKKQIIYANDRIKIILHKNNIDINFYCKSNIIELYINVYTNYSSILIDDKKITPYQNNKMLLE
jgi:hypothetical protein